jgi:hypothetical protein
MPTPFTGVLSYAALAEEGATTAGADTGITNLYKLNLSGESSFVNSQAVIEVPTYTGDRTMNPSVSGMITASGAIPQNLEFSGFLRQLIPFMGRSTYSRPGAGTTKLHRTANSQGSTAGPGSVQIESVFTSPAGATVYIRNRYVRPDGFHFKMNLQGGVTYTFDYIGTGDVQTTSLTASPTSASLVEAVIAATNYFNGVAYINPSGSTPTVLGSMTDYSIDVSNRNTRMDVAFNAGKAGAINADKMMGAGNLGLMFAADGSGPESGLTFYNYGRNQLVVLLDCMWFNAVTTAWNSYVRMRCWVKFEAKGPVPGGGTGRTTNQRYNVVNDAASVFPAEIMAALPGPYTLPATPNLGFKHNGGSTNTIALTAGSQTAAQIATALNLDSTFTAAAVAYDRANALYIVSKTQPVTGTPGTIQVDGAVANTAHTAIGLHTVAQTGLIGTPIVIEVLNTTGSDF